MKHLLVLGILAFLLPGAVLKAQRVQEEVLCVQPLVLETLEPAAGSQPGGIMPVRCITVLTKRVPLSNLNLMLGFRNLNKVAATHAGVVSINGERPHIRGARAEGTVYYIDGVRMLEMELMPQKASALYALK